MSLSTFSSYLFAGRGPAQTAPRVCAVVLNFNTAQLTLDCVNSVLGVDYPIFKVIVVENASKDDSAARLKERLTDPRVEILVNAVNEGYSGGSNRGIEKALAFGADYIWVLNNDTIADPGCLAPLVRAMEADSNIGISSCPIIENGQPCPGTSLNLFTANKKLLRRRAPPVGITDMEYIGGVALLFRAELIRRIGMYDQRFFNSWEDTDICFRARAAGYRVCEVPGPGVSHLIAQTVKHLSAIMALCGVRNRAWFIRRHGKIRHRIVFNFLAFGYYYPKLIVGRIVRGEFDRLVPALRGIWEGHWRYPGLAQESRLNSLERRWPGLEDKS